MTYPGGKAHAFTHVINQMPPHQIYIETHLGSGVVLANKKPAPILNIGLDLDPEVIASARSLHARNGVLRSRHSISSVESVQEQFLVIDAVDFLTGYPLNGSEFVYADPPYVRTSRRSDRPIYRFEYTDDDHARLLDVLTSLPCNVAISGYHSTIYASRLES